MKSKLITMLQDVCLLLSQNDSTRLQNTFLTFSDNKVLTPIGDVLPLLLRHRTTLQDQFVSLELLKQFIEKLQAQKAIIRLNHIGFCYKVDSQEKEKERLIKQANNSPIHVYQELSNDEGIWLFLGNVENWETPMIEMLPIETTNDAWATYWLPHIQIDIDTNMTEQAIRTLVKTIFGKSVIPYSISIDGTVYIVRNRLGSIDGVNIMLDLATSSRKVRYHRQHILKKIC